MSNPLNFASIAERIEPTAKSVANTRKTQRYLRPDCGYAMHRGKRRAWVGYQWTSPYSHFLNGKVSETKLAWGDSIEEALHNLEKKFAQSTENS